MVRAGEGVSETEGLRRPNRSGIRRSRLRASVVEQISNTDRLGHPIAVVRGQPVAGDAEDAQHVVPLAIARLAGLPIPAKLRQQHILGRCDRQASIRRLRSSDGRLGKRIARRHEESDLQAGCDVNEIEGGASSDRVLGRLLRDVELTRDRVGERLPLTSREESHEVDVRGGPHDAMNRAGNGPADVVPNAQSREASRHHDGDITDLADERQEFVTKALAPRSPSTRRR